MQAALHYLRRLLLDYPPPRDLSIASKIEALQKNIEEVSQKNLRDYNSPLEAVESLSLLRKKIQSFSSTVFTIAPEVKLRITSLYREALQESLPICPTVEKTLNIFEQIFALSRAENIPEENLEEAYRMSLSLSRKILEYRIYGKDLPDTLSIAKIAEIARLFLTRDAHFSQIDLSSSIESDVADRLNSCQMDLSANSPTEIYLLLRELTKKENPPFTLEDTDLDSLGTTLSSLDEDTKLAVKELSRFLHLLTQDHSLSDILAAWPELNPFFNRETLELILQNFDTLFEC